MSKGDTARQTFAAAREEIITRMQQRDTVLLGYLAAVGAIFGLVSGSPAKPGLLWMLPFLALGAAIMVAQHHEVIGSVQDFLVSELQPFLKEIHEDAPQWNSSKAHKEYSTRAIGWRFVAHFVLIPIPSLVGLYLYWSHPTEAIAWKRLGYLGIILLSVVVLMISHMYRWELYIKLKRAPRQQS